MPRVAALVVCLLGVPFVLGIAGLFKDSPIRAGVPSPRTVFAPEQLRVDDPEATERLRREAEAAVEPVVVVDSEASAAIVQRVRDAFDAARSAREPDANGRVPREDDQVEVLEERLPMLDRGAVEVLVALSDSALAEAAASAVDIARTLARQRITEDRLTEILDGQLQTELALTGLADDVSDGVVEPILRNALRPTVRIDEGATAEARAQAAAAIDDVVRTFQREAAIVRAGEVVDDLQFAALRMAGLEGSEPLREIARGALLAVVLTVLAAVHLRVARPLIWAQGRLLLLLAVLALLGSAFIVVVSLVDVGSAERHYAIPVGAVAMLATILFDAHVALLLLVPFTALVGYAVPTLPALAPYAAAAGLASIPMVHRLSARGNLRRAAWRSTLAYAVLAAVWATAFSGGAQDLVAAAVAGFAGGIATALVVNGALPFLEGAFGVLTATSLLDLADRNHPLLRELESKALGSYNHSIMVSTLVQRACRAVGGDALLGEVCALYHDIGKVAKPYFFVENQFAIQNPHDELDDPRQSALIIMRHVTDGVERAEAHRLPAEVVDGIRTHHGTTLVSYFYRRAVEKAEHDAAEAPAEEHFRYPGRKPFTKELAILMLADCCEGASRAAALEDRNLTRERLESIVRGLVRDRIDDGQLDEAPLTLAELELVEGSLIETLVGVYHPRISYPKDPRRGTDGEAAAGAEDAAAPARKPALAAVSASVEPRPRRTDPTEPSSSSPPGATPPIAVPPARTSAGEGLAELARRALESARRTRS